MKDKNGKDIAVNDVILIPFRVSKLGGGTGPLIEIQTVEKYGHDNGVVGPMSGLVRWRFWCEPTQVIVVDQVA